MVKAQVKAKVKAKVLAKHKALVEEQEKTKDKIIYVTRIKFQKPVKQSIFDLGS